MYSLSVDITLSFLWQNASQKPLKGERIHWDSRFQSVHQRQGGGVRWESVPEAPHTTVKQEAESLAPGPVVGTAFQSPGLVTYFHELGLSPLARPVAREQTSGAWDGGGGGALSSPVPFSSYHFFSHTLTPSMPAQLWICINRQIHSIWKCHKIHKGFRQIRLQF